MDGVQTALYVVHILHKVLYIDVFVFIVTKIYTNTSTIYKMRGDGSEGVRTMV